MHIDTDRLYLRPTTIHDIDDLLALHSEPEVREFMPPFDRDELVDRLRHYDEEWREYGHGMFVLLASDDGRFLGRIGLKYWPQFEEAEVGWVLRREEWGHGYATEAARACADWGFREFDYPYLTAMIRADNTRSIRVAERLGMTPRREDLLFDIPVIVHSVDRETFANS
ncbi:MAG TPA: GNAT family N-acetyltransferase [Solirubrobacteraceae bacterium]|nr:GNAT family N-acetyltransferase [Solirubrobacteraceae bacterium]